MDIEASSYCNNITYDEKLRNKVNSDLILFIVPMSIYYALIYTSLLLFHTDSMTCLIGYQLISLASVYVISRVLKVNLAEMYFNDQYNALLKNTVIFISIALLMFGTSRVFIATPPLFAAGIIGSPLLEELLFRGFLFNFLKNTVKFMPVVVFIDSLIFSVAHCAYTGDSQTLVIVFLIGIFSCYLRYRYNSLIPCTYLHLLNNLGVFLR